jgi:hypothetical protein
MRVGLVLLVLLLPTDEGKTMRRPALSRLAAREHR